MKYSRLGYKFILMLLFLVISGVIYSNPFFVYPYTKESYYNLYHKHLNNYSTNIGENIDFLEKALKSPFANPRFAIAKIEDKNQFERYKSLFDMHIALKLTQLYLEAGDRFNREHAYFFDEPFKSINLEGLDRAEKLFQFAKTYWFIAKEHSKKATLHNFIYLNEIQYWHDENYRIENGELDYEKIIDKHIHYLHLIRQKFKNMSK